MSVYFLFFFLSSISRFNRLDRPHKKRYEQLREKRVFAMGEREGFGGGGWRERRGDILGGGGGGCGRGRFVRACVCVCVRECGSPRSSTLGLTPSTLH